MIFISYLNVYILGSMMCVVGLFLLLYILKYQIPAIQLQYRTKKINKALKNYATQPAGSVQPDVLDPVFANKPFDHAWREFKNSLHEMQSEDVNTKSIRSTLTADFYFSKEAIVDSYINAEFFKHLPGILTGTGIIGTFTGLIWGLHQFNTTNAVETLSLLLSEVSSAFVGSGIAIFIAIAITFFEKNTINNCYKLLEETSNALDKLYKAGVGEDYLARLVKATEATAHNSINLKDVLIENLELMMEKQSKIIGQSIAESLTGPIDKLMLIVNKASGDQSDVIKNLVDSLMNTFITKIDEAFGTQIDAVNQAIFRSTTIMESVENSMRHLIDEISLAGQSAVKSMSEQMLEAVMQANINQDEKNQLLRNVIEGLYQLNQDHHSKSQALIEEVMQRVLSSLGDNLAQVAQSREQQNLQDENRNQLIISSAKEFQSGLQTLFQSSMSEQHELNLKLKEFVQEINQLSSTHQLQSNENMQQVVDKVLSNVDQSIQQISIEREKSNENMQQVVDKVLSNVDQSIQQISIEREKQSQDNVERNTQLVNSSKEFYETIQSILKTSQTDQYEINLQLKVFVEELNQLTYDLQVKSKEVIEQTLEKVLSSVDQSILKIAKSQADLSAQDVSRNEQIILSTKELHRGIQEQLGLSMQEQYQLNLSLKNFVSELHDMNVEHITQVKGVMLNSTTEVLGKLQSSLETIAADRTKQIESDEQRAIELNQATLQLHNRISEQVKNLMNEFNNSIQQSQNHIQAIEKVSLVAINDMNNGAKTIDQAATKFSSASKEVIDAFEQSKSITNQMETIGGKIENMITNIHSLFKQFEQSSSAHQDYVKELTSMILLAKQESGISTKIVEDMEASLKALQLSEKHSLEYLQNINQVLKDAFGQFNTQMMAQVTSLNQENDRLLGDAITSLTGAVEQIVRTTSKLAQN